MSREKYIQELNQDLLRAYGINKLYSEDVAEYLYNAGYRKASDLVNEIFSDVFMTIRKYYIVVEKGKSAICEFMIDDLKGDLAELKKKYTECENDEN